ncbi:MAG: lipid II flippase MurJ [Patescibacteria group bacterium]
MTPSRFFKTELAGVHQTALLLALTNIVNGVLGLLRDRFLAAEFGASRSLDIYYAAFRIPDILFSLSLFFIASTAFIPLFIAREEESPKKAQAFFDSLVTIFLVAMLVAIGIAYLCMQWIIPWMVPGFSAGEVATTVMLSRIMLFSPLFLGLSSLISGVIQSSKRFFAYAVAPIFYNAGIIMGVVVFLPEWGIAGLAYGVVLGAALHMVVQIPALLLIHAFPRPRISLEARPFDIVSYSFPRACALSLNQVSQLVLTAIASTLGAGAIAIFNLSHNLFALPLTIIGLSYSIAAFPTMAELVLKDEKDLFFRQFTNALRHILFWTVPATMLFIVFRAHIVRLVLGTGAFAWLDTHLTIASLFLFSFAIVTQSVVTLAVRAYYALGRIREPLKYNVASFVVTVAAALSGVFVMEESMVAKQFFAWILHIRIEDVATADIEFLALPLAYTLGSLVNAVLLMRSIFRLDGKTTRRVLGVAVKRITGLGIAMALAGYVTLSFFADTFPLETTLAVFAHAFLAGVVSITVGIMLAERMEMPEYQEIKAALVTRFSRREVLQPETEHL